MSTQAKTKAAPAKKSSAKPVKLVTGQAKAAVKKPLAKPVAKPQAVPGKAPAKPATKTAVKSAVKAPIKAAVKAKASTAKPGVKKVVTSASKTAAKTAVKTAVKAKSAPVKAKVVQAPAKSKAKAPVKAPAKAPVKASVKAPVKTSTKSAVKAPVKATAPAAAKTSSKSAPQAVVKEPVKALAKKPAPAPAKPAAKAVVKEAVKSAAKPVDKAATSPAPAAKVATGSPVLMPIGTASSGGIPRAGRPSSRLASLTVPSMAQSVASTAAKASYAQIESNPMIAPPLPSSIKKDPKLANNWKTTPADKLSDAELMAMPDDEYMNDKQLAAFRHRLVQLKNDILANAGETTEHLREDTVVVPDPADRATIEEEHALELRTRDRERKLLKKIEQSISRIDAGDYGYCDETGEPIGVGRLLARPTATLSLEAQQRRELKQKMFGD